MFAHVHTPTIYRLKPGAIKTLEDVILVIETICVTATVTEEDKCFAKLRHLLEELPQRKQSQELYDFQTVPA
jgi:hypothetical protein